MNVANVREAVGVFSDYDDLQDTIRDLETSGFGRHQISVLGSEEARREKLGTKHLPVERLEDNAAVPRSNNIAPEEIGVAQGILVGAGILGGVLVAIEAVGSLGDIATLGALAVCSGIAGGALGALLATVLRDGYRDFFYEQMSKDGGILLWVETPDNEAERRARRILEKHHATDVHIHDIKLAA